MNPILSTAAKLPEDGFYQVAALGEHPVIVTGADGNPATVIQVVDPAACMAMVNRFAQEKAARPAVELLVDYDHFSEDTDKTSEAAGWIQALENRADGLYARIQWTDQGESAVRGRRYRFLSPVWNRSECESASAGRVRPLRLDRAAVTNDPNIKGMAPLFNRTAPGAAAPAEPGPKQSPGDTGRKESTMDFKAELLAMLGLNADATDEQISAAVAAKKAKDAETSTVEADRDAMKNRAEAAEAKVVQFERAALESQVEADLTKHAGKIANRDQWKKALIANRAGALELLEALPEPAQRVLNRRDAKTPADTGADSDATRLANRRKDQDAAVSETLKKHSCTTRAQAWEIAASTNPELFS